MVKLVFTSLLWASTYPPDGWFFSQVQERLDEALLHNVNLKQSIEALNAQLADLRGACKSDEANLIKSARVRE